MNWMEKWQAISARILGLQDAANFLIQAYQANEGNYGGLNFVFSELKDIGAELQKLHALHGNEIPPYAAEYLRERLDHFFEITEPLNTAPPSGKIQSVAPLSMIRTRFEYLIRDSEIEGRNATELAFEHLRRLIVVDNKIRQDWEAALKEREERSEKLGAVHLLSHGIWGFKITGTGAATDLIYADPIDVQSPILRRTARALVLTEWKKVTDQKTALEAAKEARAQAQLYAGGLLGDVELKRTRYVVLVSPSHIEPPPDVEISGVNYRHVVIPVSKEPVSQAARRHS